MAVGGSDHCHKWNTARECWSLVNWAVLPRDTVAGFINTRFKIWESFKNGWRLRETLAEARKRCAAPGT